ncbi:MAG TPA: TSUP family transporter [Candidatus Avacidaminococcus intestinavium]|uniref:Probable membrane transporter protein n=1 Tax=Candidatus Avacidaminococcus intestinavium TaxID=2840684 RepID=A0A9D1MRU7_9FIRM|nr:TSUP family transporter [Candidatus Avacidaminococcus intestinavium]
MEQFDPLVMLFLIVAAFIAAFIDSTVGGGGLISTPALLATGMPVSLALGTNKVAATMGSLASFISFWRAGKIQKKVVLLLMPLSFIGSALGAYVVYLLPAALMKNIIVILLVLVAVYTYCRKDWGDISHVKKFSLTLVTGIIIMVFSLGFYDGFFGPGTGSFLIFSFLFLGYSFVDAAGNAKALNFASGAGALLSFAISGTVYWVYGLAMGISMIFGAVFGSRMAIKHGASYVRPLYLGVTSLLIGKQIYDLFWNK